MTLFSFCKIAKEDSKIFFLFLPPVLFSQPNTMKSLYPLFAIVVAVMAINGALLLNWTHRQAKHPHSLSYAPYSVLCPSRSVVRDFKEVSKHQ